MLSRVTREMLESDRTVSFSAPGSSMHPIIRHNETIIVRKLAPGDLSRGSILLCSDGGRLFAHRVVKVDLESSGIILRGDAQSDCDAPVGPDSILGRVVAVRRGRKVIDLTTRRSRLLASFWRILRRVKATAASLR